MIRSLVTLLLLAQGLRLFSQFQDVTYALGVQNVNQSTVWGNGASLYDFSGDGIDDLTLASGSQLPKFYLNSGGQMLEVQFGIALPSDHQVIALQWVDFDNDGDADLFITQYGGRPSLFRRDGPWSLTDITQQAGLPMAYMNFYGAAWADYNQDGWLDVFIGTYYLPSPEVGIVHSSRLWMNRGDGTFSDETIAAGVMNFPRPVFQPVWFDYNNDGWQDLYLIIDRTLFTNQMFRNNGDGTFTETTFESNLNMYVDAMSGSISDYDHDGDYDVYVSNGFEGNQFRVNNGDGTFTESADVLGLSVNAICWGALWIDADNDAWEDLFVGTSWIMYGPHPNYLFLNDNGSFLQGMEEMGISDDHDPTMVVVSGDLNNDGFPDYVTNNNDPAPSRVWENLSSENHWIGITLEGTASNRMAIGSEITLFAGGLMHRRTTHLGENYLGQNSSREIFGLGQTTILDSLIISWPNGIVERYTGLGIDQYHHFVEGETFGEPIELFLTDSTLCAGQSLVLSAPPGSDYLWTTGDTTSSIVIVNAGTYSVTYTNSWGFLISSAPVTITPDSLLDPLISVIHPSCPGMNDGGLEMTFMEESGVEVVWDSGAGGLTLDSLSAGMYAYNATSSEGCAAHGVVVIQDPPWLLVELNPTPVHCFGDNNGSFNVQVQGGTPPYTMDFNGWNPDMLPSGNYQCTVTDSLGCTTTQEVFIDQPELLQVAITALPAVEGINSGMATVEVSGGIPPYLFDWGNGPLTDQNSVTLDPGDYTVVVYDSNECSVTQTFSIDLLSQVEELFDPTLKIYPNPANEACTLISGYPGRVQVVITDVTGREVLRWNEFRSPSEIRTANWPAGLYTIRFVGQEGMNSALLEVIH